MEPWSPGSPSDPEARIFPLSPATADRHQQTARDDMAEFMIMGLRLTREGIAAAEFERRFGLRIEERFGGEIADLRGLGLLETTRAQAESSPEPGAAPNSDGRAFRLTRRGRLLGNQVFLRFVD